MVSYARRMVYAGEEDALYPMISEGLTLYRAGRWFDAHEVWEQAWKGEVGRNKETLRALIQVAAALVKHADGNPRGPSKLLAKARDTMAEVTSGCASWLGIDLIGLSAEIDRALADADAFARGERTDLPPPPLPPVTGPDGILYLHGFASGPSSFKASVILPPLVEAGYAVRVPELDEGDFEHLTVSRALALARRSLWDRTIVIGSSFGGYVATLLAEKDERVKSLVLMAPAFDLAARMRERYGETAIAEWRSSGRTMVEHYALGGRHPIAYTLLLDAARHPPFPKVRVPTYVLQGERDDVVPPGLASRFRDADPSHVELDLTDDDHALVASAERALAATLRAIARLTLQPQPRPRTIDEADARLAEIDRLQ